MLTDTLRFLVGTLQAGNRAGGGAVFTIELPAG